jgi:hypothetical protein
MTKPAIISTDPLIMKVRKALRQVEPRTMPTEKRRNPYGFECWVCPYCGELCHIRGRFGGRGKTNYGSYNMHFASMHATPFWKEKQLIKLLKRELQ